MEVLNVNVGVLGHVDSGKTSLVKALSTVLSTASLDKHPQSRERGITLDLGFSSFTMALPGHLPTDRYSHLQFTLVDCPGHASLIRTIIGGAQIMDMMLLVVDATKGMQAQTTECVVIGEAVMSSGADVIVVLNKVDLIPEEERPQRLRQLEEDIAKQLAGTKLSNASFVSCAAAVGGEKTAASTPHIPSRTLGGRTNKGPAPPRVNDRGVAAGGSEREKETPGVRPGSGKGAAEAPNKSHCTAVKVRDEASSVLEVEAVAAELSRRASVPSRRAASAPLYFAFDHCFSVRGQGTILTGTVLTGDVKVNQLVELPAIRLQKKVKSMQMFRKPVSVASAGDRVGICLASLDAKHMERGVVTTPGSVRPTSAAIALVQKVPAFTGQCLSGGYCHVSLGHTTAMATATFFGASELSNGLLEPFGHAANAPDTSAAPAPAARGVAAEEGCLSVDTMASLPFPWEASFVQQTQLVGQAGDDSRHDGVDDQRDGTRGNLRRGGGLQYCHLAFQAPVIAPPSSVVLGSRLDNTSGPSSKTRASAHSAEVAGTGSTAASEHCRIAFHGRLVVMAADANGARKVPGDAGAPLEFGTQAGQLKLFTEKSKTGVVFRVGAEGHAGGAVEVFGKDLFKKETDMSPFVGMLLLTEGGAVGKIEGGFGKAGRFKARFPAGTPIKPGDKLILKFRKYFRDTSKRMHQDFLRDALEEGRHQHIEAGHTLHEKDKHASVPPPAAARGSEDTTAGAPRGERGETPPQGTPPPPPPPPPPLREGAVDTVKEIVTKDDGTAVLAYVSGLFSQEEDIRAFAKAGMAVRTDAGLVGHLRGPFGKLGKCKVEFARADGGSAVRAGDRVFVPR
ncbi:unnamed protein product [Scytosiphon promiscuus]